MQPLLAPVEPMPFTLFSMLPLAHVNVLLTMWVTLIWAAIWGHAFLIQTVQPIKHVLTPNALIHVLESAVAMLIAWLLITGLFALVIKDFMAILTAKDVLHCCLQIIVRS